MSMEMLTLLPSIRRYIFDVVESETDILFEHDGDGDGDDDDDDDA